jgi:hypothetical protein
MLPLCFVLMPFGKKTIPSGTTVDFDAVYHAGSRQPSAPRAWKRCAPTRRFPEASSTNRCSSG